MTEQENINYNRIAEAINYIKNNFKNQPNLEDVAEEVHFIFSDSLPSGRESVRRNFYNTLA